tara:strand:+ start:16394 stop:18022 length:1629 start_codon:yes stop_codon:yes gene_type:complete
MERTGMDVAFDIGRQIAQGLTFGTADEAEAFFRSQFTGSGLSYDEEIGKIRGEMGRYQEAHPYMSFFLEAVGALPSALIGGAGLARLGVKGAAKIGAIEGGLYGFGAAEGTPAERAPEAAIGAGLGAGMSAAAQRLLPGRTTPEARQLLEEGIPLTPGQRLGGAARTLEERIAGQQFYGDIIKGAETRAMQAFNRSAMDKAIKPIGVKVPKNLTGQDAFAYAHNAVSDAYQSVLPKLSVSSDAMERFAIGVLAEDKLGMTDAAQETFSRKAKATLLDRFNKETGTLSGEALKKAESDLGQEAISLMTSGSSVDRDAGRALFDLQTALRQQLVKENPDAGAGLAAANEAFKQLLPVEKAVTVAATGQGGTFTPAQLLRGMKGAQRGPRKTRFAKGEMPMQPFASAAQDVMGRTIPDSGTAGRLDVMSLTDPMRLATRAVGIPLTSMIYGGGPTMAATTGLLGSARPLARGMSPMVAAEGAQRIEDPMSGLLGIPSAEAGMLPGTGEARIPEPGIRYETITDRLGNPVTYAITDGGASMTRVTP